MKMLDLYSGTGSVSAIFEAMGFETVSIDIMDKYNPDIVANIHIIDPHKLNEIYGPFDVVWASPPCQCFSVASIWKHWTGGVDAYIPATDAAGEAEKLIAKTLEFIFAINPTYWMMENPRGMLRRLPLTAPINREELWYCKYGETRAKPTDLWGKFPPGFEFRKCKNGGYGKKEVDGKIWIVDENGEPCHEHAERGSKTAGTQGQSGAIERGMIPEQLTYEMALAIFENEIKEE